MSEDIKFYQTTWFIVLSLIFFFPLGLILMWKNKKFGKIARIIITVFFAFVTLGVFLDEDTNTESEEKDKAEIVSKEASNEEKKQAEKEKKEKAKKEKRAKKEKINIDDKIQKDSSNVDKASLKDNVLTLKKEPSSTWSENTLVKNNVFTMFEDVNEGFKDKNVNEIKVIIEAVMIDEKGNEEVVSAVEYEYDRSTFEELNYDNFMRLAVSESWRILNHSDAYLIYPGIYKALKQDYKQGLKDNGMKIR